MQPNTASDPTVTTKPVKPRRLVVLVPGFEGQCSLWGQLRDRLEEEPGFSSDEARWLLFDHHTKRWSIGSLEALARRLHGRIVAEWIQASGFDEIILVDHSMGGLVVRHAYLLASGAVPGEQVAEWGRQVVRIVLLASLNRGIDPKRTLWIRPIAWMTRVVPFLPHLPMQDVLRGSSVITNVRVNWIRHFGALVEAQRQGERWPDGHPKRPPLVVQLLGSQDGLVHQDDSKDVLAFPRGHYLEVPDADHRSVYRLDLAADPDLRYAVLRQGFVGEFPEDLARTTVGRDGDPTKRVVFLMHGIRASNVDEWIRGLEQRIRARDSGHTDVRHPTYGYFTAARFALPTVRRKSIRVFQDWYTEALAEHPNAEFNIIAHSNGTYLLGQSLLATPGMQFTHVALAGSVLPPKFPWGELRARGQVVRVRNDRANRDWPVALLCNALRGLRMRDVGTGGVAGFEGQGTYEVAYYPGDHGAALRPDYQDLLVDFVFGGDMNRPAGLKPSPGYYRQLSNAMPYLAALAACSGLVGIAWLAFQGWLVPVLWSALAALVVYVILDII